jgi:hypothetical protein
MPLTGGDEESTEQIQRVPYSLKQELSNDTTVNPPLFLF